MSVLANSNAIETGGYNINNSLRTRASASAYLSRTPASAGNRTTWTWSGWIKRGTLGASQGILDCSISANQTTLNFQSADTIQFYMAVSGSVVANLITTQVFRDPSAWYHIVAVADTTQATASNRMKLYVNGSQVTAFGTSTYPAQNTQGLVNSTNAHYMGQQVFGGGAAFDGYRAETNFIDGQALTPSSFGATDAITGVWAPKAYTGTYGTNGFYLKFSDIATTSGSNAGLGKDFSGNSNYWTTNNISVTAGTTYDAMTDSPTLTSATVANYATFAGTNLGTYANATITEAGLKVSVSSGGTPDGGKAYAPFGMSDGSGKWYFEMTCVDPGAGNQRLCFGIANITTNPNAVAITNGYYASASGAHGNYNIGTFTTNDILQVAYDSGSNKLWFGKNGTWYNSGNPAAGTTPLVTVTSGITYAPFSTYASSGQGPGVGAWNFGQRPFSYTPPTGFNRLNAYNLPDSTIKKGNSYMDATLYTGNGGTQSVVNASGFKPDLVWSKSRSQASGNHLLTDSVRGTTKSLMSNDTGVEGTRGVTAFNSNGFTYIYPNEGGDGNFNAATYVAWQWQAGQGTTSNITVNQYGSTPSIASTVSVNTTAGFSIVTWTGTGSAATVGHGLGVAPKMVISKKRNGLSDWAFWITGFAGTELMELNGTSGKFTGATVWNSTTPTSTVFSIGSATQTNNSGGTYVAYLWAEIAGFSKFGSYTGNGSADGPMIFTGFKPKFVMFKRTDTTSGWYIYDSTRNTSNVVNLRLLPNTSDAEATVTTLDFLSNGFKLRTSDVDRNASGGTYIYACFAENPFKNALAR